LFIDIFEQLLIALNQCHTLGFFHQDITLDNIGFEVEIESKKLHFYLIDYSHSKILCHPYNTMSHVNNLEYAPPEFYFYNYLLPGSIDIWSLGIVIGDLLLLNETFWNDESDEFIEDEEQEEEN